MLDGNRYFAEFPDEAQPRPSVPLVSDELLVTLKAIEREISAFLRGGAQKNVATDGDPVRD
ncbi:MAG: hypothetical protein ACRECO_16695 [Xanthobacteraceae bacterium]